MLGITEMCIRDRHQAVCQHTWGRMSLRSEGSREERKILKAIQIATRLSYEGGGHLESPECDWLIGGGGSDGSQVREGRGSELLGRRPLFVDANVSTAAGLC